MAAGFVGQLDFSGIPEGAVPVAPEPGFYGQVDFSGIPYGAPTEVPPTTGNLVYGAWCQCVIQEMIQRERDRSVLDRQARRLVTELVRKRLIEETLRERHEMRLRAINTVLLAEL